MPLKNDFVISDVTFNWLLTATVIIAALLAIGSEAGGVTYVSNLAESYDAEFLSNGTTFAHASAFTTGGLGYALTGVTLSAQANTVGHAEVRIRSDSGGQPGDFLASLGTQSLSDGLQNLTYPASGLSLLPNTTYWITAGETGSGDFNWTGTTSMAETSSGSWTIGDQTFVSADGGANWTPVSFGPPNESARFSVDADVSLAGRIEWVNPDGGFWGTSTNWSSGSVPNASDADVLFGSAATHTMAIAADINVTVNSITFDNSDFNYFVAGAEGHKITLAGDAVVDVQSGTHTLGFIAGTSGLVKAGPGTLVLNSANTLSGVVSVNQGTLELIPTTALQNVETIVVNPGSAIVSEDAVIGQGLGSNVTASVTGSGASWMASGDFNVGYDGTGAVTIQDGGFVSSASGQVGLNAGSEGTVDILGAGSSWSCANGLNIGKGGNGLVTVQDGAELQVGGDIVLGSEGSLNGQLVASGTGTTVQAISGTISVGETGNGLLGIQDGAVVTSQNGYLGHNSPDAVGTVYVDGTNAVWQVGGDFVVGDLGSGELLIRNGGSVVVGDGVGTLTVGAGFGSSGEIRIGDGGDGPAGSLLAGEVTGGLGSASLVFQHAESSYTFAPVLSGSLSVYHFNTGTTILTGANTYSGTTNVEGGTLIVNGTHTGGGAYTVYAGGTLGGNGTINAPVTVYGKLAPGNSPGILTIDGDYTQAATGTLEIEVGGLTPGNGPDNHDQVVVSGVAALDGRLEVPIINGFVPNAGDEITFLTAGLGVTGEFNALTAPGLASANPNVAVAIQYNANDVRLRFVAPATDIQFHGQLASVDWANATTWTTNTVPDTTNIIAVQNLTGGPQRVDVQTENAFVHELTVASNTAPITVGVQPGFSLSATHSVSVGSRGIIELNGGNLVSGMVEVQDGGQLSGIGTVAGHLVVGAASGASNAMLSPGTTASPNGHLDVEGTYEQGANGTLAIDIHGSAADQFDTVAVTGQAKLGGALVIDATGLAPPTPGTVPTFPFLSAGSLSSDPDDVFSSVTTVGNPDIYFAAIYSSDSGAGTGSGAGSGARSLGGGASSGGAGAAAGEYAIGDMNRDGSVNASDTDLFALALANRKAYYNSKQANNACICVSGDISGDVNGNGRLDFGDIRKFATLVSGSGSASYTDTLARIDWDLSRVPEPSSILLIACGGLFMAMRFGKMAPVSHQPTAVRESDGIARR